MSDLSDCYRKWLPAKHEGEQTQQWARIWQNHLITFVLNEALIEPLDAKESIANNCLGQMKKNIMRDSVYFLLRSMPSVNLPGITFVFPFYHLLDGLANQPIKGKI